jgi:hypothetical protein
MIQQVIPSGSLIENDRRYIRSANEIINDIEYADAPEETMIMMGNAFVNIARCFINKNRMINDYCSSPFGYRNKGNSTKELKKIKEYSYPAIALRNLRTMEFRLYPSTNSVNFSLARIELSQKLVEYMYQSLSSVSDFGKGINRDNMPDIYKLMDLSVAVNHIDCVYPTNLVEKLGDLLCLSKECRTHLDYIYNRNHIKSASDTFRL